PESRGRQACLPRLRTSSVASIHEGGEGQTPKEERDVGSCSKLKERPIRLEPQHDLPDGFETAGARERVLRDHMHVAEISLERLLVANSGRARGQADAVDRLGGGDDSVAGCE